MNGSVAVECNSTNKSVSGEQVGALHSFVPLMIQPRMFFCHLQQNDNGFWHGAAARCGDTSD